MCVVVVTVIVVVVVSAAAANFLLVAHGAYAALVNATAFRHVNAARNATHIHIHTRIHICMYVCLHCGVRTVVHKTIVFKFADHCLTSVGNA